MEDPNRRLWDYPQLMKSLLAILAIIGIFCFSRITARDRNDWEQEIKEVLNRIKIQEDIDRRLIEEMQSGLYTFENPLVILDPYDASPLSALVVFRSEEPLECSVTIIGKDTSGDIGYTIPNFRAEHWIPIYGLYPDQETCVRLEAKTLDGKVMSMAQRIKTDSLPSVHANASMTIRTKQPEKRQKGLYLISFSDSEMAFDSNGDIRWLQSIETGEIALFKEGTRRNIFSVGSTRFGDALLFESSLLGRIHSVYYSPYGVHHDIQEGKNGNLLVTGSFDRDTIEDVIYEIDTATGMISRVIDLRKILPKNRNEQPKTKRDWLHLNAVVWLDEEETMLISGRNQSIVMEFYRDSGIPQWILADHQGWPIAYYPYLLKPVGLRFDWPTTQHAPEVLPDVDNNPNTMDILLFDNGKDRLQHDNFPIAGEKGEIAEASSRLAQYRVNEKEMTVELVWQYGSARPDLYSEIRGDADRLSSGHYIGLFDLEGSDGRSVVLEINPSNGETVFEAEINRDGYRVECRELITEGDLELEIGAPVRNFVPKGVVEKYDSL